MSLERRARLETRTPLERGKPLRATKWGTRPRAKKASWRDEYMPERMADDAPKLTPFEKAWLSFVRSLTCCCAHLGGCRGRSQASHITLSANQKGTGMPVNIQQTVPHCDFHHKCWDGRQGRTGNPFNDLSKEERYALGTEWVDAVMLSATPEGDRAQADELERWGIGKVIGDGSDSWAWLPGGLTEVAL